MHNYLYGISLVLRLLGNSLGMRYDKKILVQVRTTKI